MLYAMRATADLPDKKKGPEGPFFFDVGSV